MGVSLNCTGTSLQSHVLRHYMQLLCVRWIENLSIILLQVYKSTIADKLGLLNKNKNNIYLIAKQSTEL